MKYLFRQLILPVVLITTALLTGCASYTDVREHKELSHISPNIRSVAILPPDVTIQKINFTGENEMLTDKQNQISKTLADLLAQKLRSSKLEVKSFDFASAAAGNPDFAYAVTQCKKAFVETEKSLYAKPVEVKNKASFSETIGGLGNQIAETAGVDAFVIVHYDGFEKSGGMMAKDIAASVLIGVLTGYVPMQASEGSALTIGIVAADSGEVLWTNRKVHPQLNTQALDVALKDMPKTTWGAAKIATAQASPVTDAATVAAATATSEPAPAPVNTTENTATPGI